MLTETEIQALLAAAVAAPSADNHHGWRLHVEADQLRLTHEGLARQDKTRRRLTEISLGAVAESLRIRASSLGLSAEPLLVGRASQDPIRVHLARSDAVANDPLDASLEKRHSNRSLRYSGPRLEQSQLDMLQRQTQHVATSWLRFLDEPSLRAPAVGLIRRAEVERFRNRALHEELFSSVRFDAGWVGTCDEGLPPASLGVHLLERPGFQMMRHWGVQRAMNLLGAHHMLGFRSAALPARMSPHLCLIGASGPEPAALLAAGRLLLRIWTQAQALGLAAQVLAAAPIYALSEATAIPSQLQRDLKSGWQALCGLDTPFVVLRLGYAPEPPVRAGRPGAKHFLA